MQALQPDVEEREERDEAENRYRDGRDEPGAERDVLEADPDDQRHRVEVETGHGHGGNEHQNERQTSKYDGTITFLENDQVLLAKLKTAGLNNRSCARILGFNIYFVAAVSEAGLKLARACLKNV